MSSFDRDPEGLSAIIFLLRWLNKFPSTQLSLSQVLKHLTVICFGQGHYKSLGITQAQHAIGYTETIKKNYSNLWVKFQRHLNSKICWWWNNACLCIPSGSMCSLFHLWHSVCISDVIKKDQNIFKNIKYLAWFLGHLRHGFWKELGLWANRDAQRRGNKVLVSTNSYTSVKYWFYWSLFSEALHRPTFHHQWLKKRWCSTLPWLGQAIIFICVIILISWGSSFCTSLLFAFGTWDEFKRVARCLFLVSFYNELDRFSPLTSIISLDVHHFDRELKGTVHLKMKTGENSHVQDNRV